VPERYFGADELVEMQSFTTEMVDLLRVCVAARVNVFVTGAPGAGKTAMLSLLRSFIPVGEPGVVVQVGASPGGTDAAGALVFAERGASVDGHSAVTRGDLLRMALNLRPERIVLECAGPEAREMLEAMARGVNGWLTSVDGASPQRALSWLGHLALSAEPPVSAERVAEWIAESVDLVVHVQRVGETRKVTSIAEVDGANDSGHPVLNELFRFERGPSEDLAAGQFKAIGKAKRLPTRIAQAGIRAPDSI
jgi:pilus assembly protein CpaF